MEALTWLSPRYPLQEVCSVQPDWGSALQKLVVGNGQSRGQPATDGHGWTPPECFLEELRYHRKPSREGSRTKIGRPRAQWTQLILLRIPSAPHPPLWASGLGPGGATQLTLQQPGLSSRANLFPWQLGGPPHLPVPMALVQGPIHSRAWVHPPTSVGGCPRTNTSHLVLATHALLYLGPCAHRMRM